MSRIAYFIIMLVLKLKGVKKNFSSSPINVQKLRKEDMHAPAKKLLSGNKAASFKLLKTTVTELSPAGKAASDCLILYCPGGAFVYGPTELNWLAIARLVKRTQMKAWLIDYPKAPEVNIREIAANIDAVYAEALKHYSPTNIVLMGDSVGGNLMITLVQRLIKAGAACPSLLIGISPVFDASLSNPEIERMDKLDPILSKAGALSAKMMCVGGMALTDPAISPLYGSFEGFPATCLFVVEHDIMMPDQQLAIRKMQAAQVKLQLIEGKGMPHIWPLLPLLPEAKQALSKIEELMLHRMGSEKSLASVKA